MSVPWPGVLLVRLAANELQTRTVVGVESYWNIIWTDRYTQYVGKQTEENEIISERAKTNEWGRGGKRKIYHIWYGFLLFPLSWTETSHDVRYDIFSRVRRIVASGDCCGLSNNRRTANGTRCVRFRHSTKFTNVCIRRRLTVRERNPTDERSEMSETRSRANTEGL